MFFVSPLQCYRQSCAANLRGNAQGRVLTLPLCFYARHPVHETDDSVRASLAASKVPTADLDDVVLGIEITIPDLNLNDNYHSKKREFNPPPPVPMCILVYGGTPSAFSAFRHQHSILYPFASFTCILIKFNQAKKESVKETRASRLYTTYVRWLDRCYRWFHIQKPLFFPLLAGIHWQLQRDCTSATG